MNMKVPFVTFKPLEKELDKELRAALNVFIHVHGILKEKRVKHSKKHLLAFVM